MSPILDLSNGASWVTGGFVAGLVVYWLLQALFHRKPSRVDELERIASQLDAAKGEVATLRGDFEDQASKANYYEAEYNLLFEPTAGEVPRLRNEILAARKEAENLCAKATEAADKVENIHQEKIANLQAKLDSSRSVERAFKQDITSANSQLAKLANELAASKLEIEGWGRRFAELQERKDVCDSNVSRLTSELTAASNAASEASLLRSEVTRLKNEMSTTALDLQAGVQERSRLGEEVERLTRALSIAYADLRNTIRELETAKHELRHAGDQENSRLDEEVERLTKALSIAYADLRNTIRELQTANHELRQVQRALERASDVIADRSNEVEQLKAQLAAIPADADTLRKYKEALDAAKRITANLIHQA